MMHAKSGLRVLLEWKINRPDSVITAVITLRVTLTYSIRTTGLTFVVAALLLSLFLSTRQVRTLEKRLRELRDSHGMYTQDLEGTGGDRWEWVSIGDFNYKFNDTILLRVSNFQRYGVRVHFYDGTTDQYKTDLYKLASIDTAIRLIPAENTIYIHETTTPTQSALAFKISATDHTYLFHFGNSSGAIDNDPVFGFGMTTDLSDGPEGVNPEFYYGSRERIENTCRKHRLKIAWFTIEQ